MATIATHMVPTVGIRRFDMTTMSIIFMMAICIIRTGITLMSMPLQSTRSIPCSAHRKRSARTSMARRADTKPYLTATTSITSWMDGCTIPMVLIATIMGRYRWPDHCRGLRNRLGSCSPNASFWSVLSAGGGRSQCSRLARGQLSATAPRYRVSGHWPPVSQTDAAEFPS